MVGARPTSGVTTTALPQAIASSAAMPKFSESEGMANRSQDAHQFPFARAEGGPDEAGSVRNPEVSGQALQLRLAALVVIAGDHEFGRRERGASPGSAGRGPFSN